MHASSPQRVMSVTQPVHAVRRNIRIEQVPAFPVDRVHDGLEQVPQAHDDMDNDRATGKLVVRVRHEDR